MEDNKDMIIEPLGSTEDLLRNLENKEFMDYFMQQVCMGLRIPTEYAPELKNPYSK
ncbi:hypothetical protein HSE3_gp126 [Bacillus phage vB_BceM-HSE3]|nr:hypothetical protein HSE3_gp126 [Bacillus phage vB_BceM-HSE3]